MKKLFGARSQAIQLSLDDEDELGSMSSSFGGCIVPCLPCLTPFNGIQLNVEDATLDDYLDPNTPTAIDVLLDSHEESGPAALQSPRHYLTRNPFASSSKVDTPKAVDVGTHNEQLGSSADALPWVGFFLEKDDDDAEFLSDHRISTVIDDTSKVRTLLRSSTVDWTLSNHSLFFFFHSWLLTLMFLALQVVNNSRTVATRFRARTTKRIF